MTPGGVRLGTPAITTRGMKESDMAFVGDYLDRLSRICVDVQNKGGKNLKDFVPLIQQNSDIKQLSQEVEVKKFPNFFRNSQASSICRELT